ncbi:unnamed protein product [Lactuca saligna]|uniref:Uncharacterized protein n=1 Tax=Lactuca saligna TaxID=75948 RepID=A0AA36E6T5_LACSI|nr:unnamed protein product [Lactuca saligna]
MYPQTHLHIDTTKDAPFPAFDFHPNTLLEKNPKLLPRPISRLKHLGLLGFQVGAIEQIDVASFRVCYNLCCISCYSSGTIEVIRLTSPSFSFQKHNAALVIQTFFKRYLARRAVEALKGVLKLQALVRGHNVRRRTKMIVKCKQALVCVQARVCDQRRKLSDEGSFDSNIFWGSHLADNNSITREESSINTDEWDRRHACRIEI